MACLHPMGITRSNTLRCIYPFQGLTRGCTLAIRPYSRPGNEFRRNLRSCAKYPVAQLQQQRAATSAYSARRTPISTAQVFECKGTTFFRHSLQNGRNFDLWLNFLQKLSVDFTFPVYSSIHPSTSGTWTVP